MVRVIGPTPASLDGFLRRLSGDQAIAAVANQVLPPGLNECLPHGKPIIRLKKLHQRPLHLTVPKSLGYIDLLLGERVDACVVKCCGDVWGQSGKVPCQSVTNQQVQACHIRHVNRVQVSECSANVDNGLTI
jgi:hypothetical protein